MNLFMCRKIMWSSKIKSEAAVINPFIWLHYKRRLDFHHFPSFLNVTKSQEKRKQKEEKKIIREREEKRKEKKQKKKINKIRELLGEARRVTRLRD